MTNQELRDKLEVLIKIREDILKQSSLNDYDAPYRYSVGYSDGLKMALSYLKEDEGDERNHQGNY